MGVTERVPRRNIFYAVVLAVGAAFTVTACAYGVMTVVGSEPDEFSSESEAGRMLLAFLDRHGASMLGWELIVLFAAAIAAVTVDVARRRKQRSIEGASGQPADDWVGKDAEDNEQS